MSKTPCDINEILLECHRKGQELAREESIRSQIPLVVSKDGKIYYIKPQFEYKLVRKSKKKSK